MAEDGRSELPKPLINPPDNKRCRLTTKGKGMDDKELKCDDHTRQQIFFFSCALLIDGPKKTAFVVNVNYEDANKKRKIVSQKFPIMQQAVIQLLCCPDQSDHVLKHTFPIK